MVFPHVVYCVVELKSVSACMIALHHIYIAASLTNLLIFTHHMRCTGCAENHAIKDKLCSLLLDNSFDLTDALYTELAC